MPPDPTDTDSTDSGPTDSGRAQSEPTEPAASQSLSEAIERLNTEIVAGRHKSVPTDGEATDSQGESTATQLTPELTIGQSQIAALEAYCQALWRLNEQINLTRHTTYDLFARRDLLDTWHLAKFIPPNEEVLDLGTGGGVPGIPLAILRPDLKISLCDSVGKKARAVDQLVGQLKLPIYVHAARVQDVLEESTFDTLVTRAAGSITQLCNWLKDYWHCFNQLLAIKGPRWVEERGEARHRGVLHGIRLRRIHGYRMPGTKSESVLLQMEKPR